MKQYIPLINVDVITYPCFNPAADLALVQEAQVASYSSWVLKTNLNRRYC